MSWKRICGVGDVAVNKLQKFTVDGIDIVVANMGGEFRAFPPVCPHMEEPLMDSGICDGNVLTCSKHLWQWDLNTGAKVGVAERDMLLYEVKREGGDVMANLEKELVYDWEDE